MRLISSAVNQRGHAGMVGGGGRELSDTACVARGISVYYLLNAPLFFADFCSSGISRVLEFSFRITTARSISCPAHSSSFEGDKAILLYSSRSACDHPGVGGPTRDSISVAQSSRIAHRPYLARMSIILESALERASSCLAAFSFFGYKCGEYRIKWSVGICNVHCSGSQAFS
jgi:hypothetical protein